jgi:hypothetical protein
LKLLTLAATLLLPLIGLSGPDKKFPEQSARR